jgi:hypothetical protein
MKTGKGRISFIHEWIKKGKDTLFNFSVPSGGADVCFVALQPGSAMGRGKASYAFAYSTCLPSIDFFGTRLNLG